MCQDLFNALLKDELAYSGVLEFTEEKQWATRYILYPSEDKFHTSLDQVEPRSSVNFLYYIFSLTIIRHISFKLLFFNPTDQ